MSETGISSNSVGVIFNILLITILLPYVWAQSCAGRNKLPSWKKNLIGDGNGNGLVYKIAIYFLSITFAFVFTSFPFCLLCTFFSKTKK